MALDFYAWNPPEAVPYWTDIEAMSDTALEAQPLPWLEWVAISMDRDAAEIEGTCRQVDAAALVWEQCLPSLHGDAWWPDRPRPERQYAIARADRVTMRATLDAINYQRARVQRLLDRRQEAG